VALAAYIEAWLLLEAAGAKTKGKIIIGTVKGDVHDIGRNIVTVVLAVTASEVVNMGGWCPATRFCAPGARHRGLSGLITPSLEEMQYVAPRCKGRPPASAKSCY
jgi:5-methyltetrahydrofolate--homocysteine methyltransferase